MICTLTLLMIVCKYNVAKVKDMDVLIRKFEEHLKASVGSVNRNENLDWIEQIADLSAGPLCFL